MEFSIKRTVLSLFVLSASVGFVQAEEGYTTLAMAFVQLSKELDSGSASWLDALKEEDAQVITVINNQEEQDLLATRFTIGDASSYHTITKTGDIVKIKSRLGFIKDVPVGQEQDQESIEQDIRNQTESYRGVSDGSTLCYEIALPIRLDTDSQMLTVHYLCDCDTELTYQEFLQHLDKYIA